MQGQLSGLTRLFPTLPSQARNLPGAVICQPHWATCINAQLASRWINFSLCQVITFPIWDYRKYLALLPRTPVKCLAPSSQTPAQRYWGAAATSPQSRLSWRSPAPPPSPSEQVLQPQPARGLSAQLPPAYRRPSCTLGPKAGCGISGVAQQVPSRRKQPIPSIYWLQNNHQGLTSPAASRLQTRAEPAVPQVLPGPFQHSSSPSSHPPPCPRYIYSIYKIKGSNRQVVFHFKLGRVTVLHILTRLSWGHALRPFHPRQQLTYLEVSAINFDVMLLVP